MKGITMEELREEWLVHWHEAEFTYRGTPYVLQPEVNGDETDLVIWVLGTDPACICKHPIPRTGDIPMECIDAVMNDKCIDGKSFMEIQDEITVDAIM